MVLALWAVAYAAGVAVALLTPLGAAAVCTGVALVAVGGALVRRSPVLAVAALCVAAGIARTRAAWPDDAPARAGPVAITGRIVRGPDLDEARETSRVRLDLQQVDGLAAGGTVALSFRGAVPDIGPGDVIAVQAVLRSPEGLANPGLPDARLLAAARQVDYMAGAQAAEVKVVARGNSLAPRRIAWRLRQALEGAIARGVANPAAALLRTLVLGARSGVAPEVEEGFRAAGATHVLSVSGLHLAAVAAIVFGLLRAAAAAVPAVALRVAPARLAAGLALPAVGMYTLLTGEAVATERAALMAALALGAVLVGRRFSIAAALGGASLWLLMRSPFLLLDVSFQLSFASVAALALFAGALAPASPSPDDGRARRVGVWIGRMGAASIAAGLVTAPMVAHHFGEVTPAAPLGNLILVPLVEMLVLPLGLGGAVLGAIQGYLGAAPLWLAEMAARVALGVAELFRRCAPVLLVRSPDASETATLVAGCGLFLAGLGRMGNRRRSWWAGAAVCVTMASGSLGMREWLRRTSDQVRVTFLDVGQGDAAVVEGPRGFVALIDGGGSYDGSFDPGARVIEPYLRRRGIPSLDLVVLSHPHPDHLNGLLRVISRFEVKTLWTSGDDGRNPVYRQFIELARQRGVAMPTPHPLFRDGLAMVPVAPWVDDRIAAPPDTGVNDASLVVHVSFGERAVLFSGDIEEDGEAELLGRARLGVPVAAEIIKVPHHGSRTSSSAELLAAVRPRLAVISLGRGNRFGFPRPEVLARYAGGGVRVLRTDQVGAVTVFLGPAPGDATCVRGCR